MELHPETVYGLRLGSRLWVPEGTAGVVAKDGRTLDVLPPGDHLLEASLLPQTLQALKVRPGTVPPSPLPAVLFLVATAAWMAPWGGAGNGRGDDGPGDGAVFGKQPQTAGVPGGSRAEYPAGAGGGGDGSHPRGRRPQRGKLAGFRRPALLDI